MGSNGNGEMETKDQAKKGSRRVAERVAERIDETTSRVGRGVESAGEATRERVTHAADDIADKAASFGGYLQDHEVAGMANDVANVVRRYPVQSMMVGLGLGFMIGRMTSR
jgi:hypothetical protein